MKTAIRLHPDDNVLVVLIKRAPGDPIAESIAATDIIPAGHKAASTAIPAGAPLRKFGQIIGFATQPISPGQWVHEHNTTMGNVDLRVEVTPTVTTTPAIPTEATFAGYRRPDGRAGTRNYLGIVSSVNCSATVSRAVAHEITRAGLLDEYDGLDGIVPVVHGAGCGLASRGEGFDLLQRTLRGYACHPNFAAVIAIGLGCEVMQVARVANHRVHTLTIQDAGGTRATVARAVDLIRELAPDAARARREPIQASELVLGLQCGASDGYSGLTANPALGVATDFLVAAGGTAILSETPEIYGAEHLLTARAADQFVSAALMARIAWWQDYTTRLGGEMNSNPSPGNKAGGLTTILEKSLGAVAKAGSTTLQAVYSYAEQIRARGLVFMDTPGYDPVSATGQVAGGANVICFTTGRGSAFGCKPVPSIKLATNSTLFQHMPDDMDIDCGDILEGTKVADKGAEIFARILAVASGEFTKSELLGYGDEEFVPWSIGAVM